MKHSYYSFLIQVKHCVWMGLRPIVFEDNVKHNTSVYSISDNLIQHKCL